MIFWFIWVTWTGFDLAEDKPGPIFMPIWPCVPGDYPVVSCFDFQFFKLLFDLECQCCVSDFLMACIQIGLGEHISLLRFKMNLAAKRLCMLCISTLHQLKLFQISDFWESLCQEICFDCRASVGTENVSPVQSTLLTLGDFLPGCMFDSCSGLCVPSHWPDNHHEANYSHRQLMFPSSGSHGNDSIMQRISVKSVTFGNISLK